MASTFAMQKANVVARDRHGDEIGRFDGVSVTCRNGWLTLRQYRSTTIVGGPYEGVERAEVIDRSTWLVHLTDGTTFEVHRVKCNCGGRA